MATENQTTSTANWCDTRIHFGKKQGTRLGDLSPRDLKWWKDNWRPEARFCKSKVFKTVHVPEFKTSGYDDDDDEWCDGYVVNAHDIQERQPDPVNCTDCALRAALDAAEIVAATPAPATTAVGEGDFMGAVGSKVTVNVTVGDMREWEAEFNRKKVCQQSAYMVAASGELFYYKSGAMPIEIKTGETLTLTGTVKEHFVNKEGKKVTSLKLVKVAGAARLSPTHRMVLYTDAKSSSDQYAICREGGDVLEYGSCGLGCPSNGDNSSHELYAAMRAFQVAARVKDRLKVDCLELELRFDAQWMQGMVGKALPLKKFARDHNLVVKMIWISGAENPADEWTTAAGSRLADDAELDGLDHIK